MDLKIQHKDSKKYIKKVQSFLEQPASENKKEYQTEDQSQ